MDSRKRWEIEKNKSFQDLNRQLHDRINIQAARQQVTQNISILMEDPEARAELKALLKELLSEDE